MHLLFIINKKYLQQIS